ncbi:MAG: hypothetical protein QGF90_11685, partial [Gammaproteobacteria bacterium]|nr:hypothetical protein [Gammaproteobacteria bacterium]
MAEIFSSVTLVYATKALPPPTEPTSPPSPIQAQIEDFADQAEAFGIEVEQLGTEVTELITEVATLITESGELGGEIQEEIGTALSDIAAQVEIPPDLQTELTDLQTQLGGLDLGQFALNRLLATQVAFPGPPPAAVLQLSIAEILRLSQENPAELERLLAVAQGYLTALETYLVFDQKTDLMQALDNLNNRAGLINAALSFFTGTSTLLSNTLNLLGQLDTANPFVSGLIAALQARLDEINNQIIPPLQAQQTNLENQIAKVQDRLDNIDALLGTIDQLRSATSLEEVLALATGGLGQLGGLNRQIVFDPDMYNREPLQSRMVGDQVIWETTVDVELGNTYYYYYEVELALPLDFDVPGLPADYDRWSIPDPRNLQLEDRGIVEQLFTEELQDAIAPILDPVVQAVVSGGPTDVTITPEQQQVILDIITANAEPLFEEILLTLDPRIASLFTVPTLNSSQSLWAASFDFDTNADGEYELDAS